MNPENLFKHFDLIGNSPEFIGKMRAIILHLALAGRLSESKLQSSNETLDLQSLEADQSTTLPLGWHWRQLGEVARFINGDRSKNYPSKTFQVSDGIPFINAGHLVEGDVSLSTMNYITQEHFDRLGSGKVEKGDVLYCLRGSLGKCAVVQSIDRGAIASSLLILRPSQQIAAKFLYLFLISPFGSKMVAKYDNGTAQPNLSAANVRKFLVPLPPLAEQKRIVAKVDELMGLCDRLEAAQAERESRRERLTAASLERLNKPADGPEYREHARFHLQHFPRFTTRPDQIPQLRQTILSLAVRGKLVPQNPKDEPAIEVLKNVSIERRKLIESGRIRRESPISPPSQDQRPFELPASWEWAKVGQAALFTEYGTSEKSYDSETGIPVLKMGDIQDGLLVLGGQKKVPENCEDLPNLFLDTYDLLYNRTNSAELVGKTGIFLGKPGTYTFASYLIRIRCSTDSTSPVFFNYAMNAPYFRATQIIPHLKQQCGQANVNGTILKSMLIPLPPLAEQKRIVAKIDELMKICDQLEASLTTTQTKSTRLLEALLHEALAPAQ